MGHIHVLPPRVANQIAAGEVVERPASAVKELVENSIDAGASRITIRIEKAGKRLIEVEDDGCGMSVDDAQLSVQRHATSKITDIEDLHRIASHGFRGEALPSIAAVSRFQMHTALAGAREGCEVLVEGGSTARVQPAPPRKGTRIRVRDLFLNTPARLRFMRSDRTEEALIVETVRMLALANPGVAFALYIDGRVRFDLPAQTDAKRVHALLGKGFAENSVHRRVTHEDIVIDGWFGLPTHHHRDASRIYILLNGRVIRDRALIAVMRAAYQDVLFHDRYPVAVVRIEMDPASVDVNVHPAKREVRFRSPGAVRSALVAAVRTAIGHMGRQVSTQTSLQALRSMSAAPRMPAGAPRQAPMRVQGAARMPSAKEQAVQRLLFAAAGVSEPSASEYARPAEDEVYLDLGRPLAQIHRCYLLAQTDDGIVLIDQHAAHERITYERMKRQIARQRISSQQLLAPVRWQPDERMAAWLHEHWPLLERFGFVLHPEDGSERFLITAVPAMLTDEDPERLAEELVEACMLIGPDEARGDSGAGRIVERWLGNHACRSSVKSGRILAPEEQEQLLREMERTPNIGQCNHGRPTYVRLSLNDLDRLFGRRG
ncbi:MAG: DNA mismatch repair endonuclease MutL [Zetaproteobacteria bacterium]|nr:MAG: DNA mismatch repair endonuclease MutL [Zetaproteobacteria bacterium]